MHFPALALPGALPLLQSPSAQAIAAQVFGQRASWWHPGSAYISAQLGFNLAGTPAKTYTFPNRNITVAGLDDIGTAGALASDTDGTLTANSDLRIATQKAVKTYVGTATTGILKSANNLSDLASATTSRTNIGSAALAGSASQAFSTAALGASGIITATGGMYMPQAQPVLRFYSNNSSDWIDLQALNQTYAGLKINNFTTQNANGVNAVFPNTDNVSSLGISSSRWSTVYAATGTINTSDAREKTSVRAFSTAEIAAAKQLSKEIGAYQWLAAIKEKGVDAREHIGLTVQRAIEIMQENGLDPFNYGFICYDKWDQATVEHPAIEAVAEQAAVPAKYDSIAESETIIIDGEEVEMQRMVLREVSPAVLAVKAVEAKDAWTEIELEAGDRYAFRYDELNLFIARGIEARLAALEEK